MDDPGNDLELISRSLSIHERVSRVPELPAAEAEASPEVAARVEAWARQVSPGGEQDRFERRLSWLNLDRAGAARVASEPALEEALDRPGWLDIAVRARELLLSEPEPESVECAFGEYWQAWGAVGRARLEARLGEAGCELLAPVLADLERGLVFELSSLGSSCLLSAFDEHRLPWQLGPGYLIARLSATPPNELYRAFVRELRTSPLVWRRWPALIRLSATRVSCWVDAISEFARRLHADRAALAGVAGRELGPLVSLNDRASDSHNGGRRVHIARFENDVELVYKPRSVRSELAFNEVVKWTNERLPDGPHLESHWVLARDRYGWAEYVAPMPCPESEARNYYERAGMLLGLVYVLVGSDCHEENVIAHGACPVLVDLETLAGPRPLPSPDAQPEYAEAIERLETESVLTTGLLPGWTFNPGADPDISGLGGQGKNRLFRFAQLNTDLMRLVQGDEQRSRLTANQPRLDSGVAIEADLHVDAIARGFERVYALVCQQMDDFVAPDGPLACLQSGRARFVFRDTREYTRVLGASLKPRAMQDGFARSLSMEGLANLLLEVDAPDWALALLRHEHEALQRGDVPLFSVDRKSGALFVRVPELGEDREIGRMPADGTGLRRLEGRLRRLGPADLRLQRQCIDASFIARAIRAETCAVRSAHTDPGSDLSAGLEEAALGIARAVLESSVVGPRGSRFWLGLEPESSDQASSRVGVIGPWLYSGQAGIALALSAAFARRREPSFASAALAALAPIRELVLESPASWPLGAFDGLSGVLYVLWHSARLLDEPALVDDARKLLRGIDRESVERDGHFDVISGVAGLILAVRCLEPVEKQRVHELVEASARHLVRHAKRVEDGVGWPNWLQPTPLCGMAHGNSGVALALMEAFRMTGDRTFREVGLAAVAYERAQRSRAADGGWPDLRRESTNAAGWCHGPPGIALARSAMLEVEDSPELRAELELARALIEDRAPTEPRAHLCCGQTGIDDALLELGLRLRDSASADLARRRASSRVRTLGEDPGVWMQPKQAGEGIATIPSLMKGWSGIAWTLLRLSDPGRELPCVLTLGT